MTLPSSASASVASRPSSQRSGEVLRVVAWASLGITLAVILWGAYVRVSGSGAGCGSHWPTCNGQVVPRSPSMKTVVEFTHRLTSGLSLIAVVVQLILCRKRLPAGHLARRAAGWSVVFMVLEALVGAAIVLLEKVAYDKSTARVWWMCAHLTNTFLLLAVLSLVPYGLMGEDAAPSKPVAQPPLPARWPYFLGAASVLVVGISGAITALGDTLFPASSLAEGLRADVSITAHVAVRLRVLHPIFAIGSAAFLLWLGQHAAGEEGASASLIRRSRILQGLVVAQVALGALNLGLLAPAVLQIGHLALADGLWLALIWLMAEALGWGKDKSLAMAAHLTSKYQTLRLVVAKSC